jgi:hypothetical protein
MFKTNDQEIRILGFQAHGKNVTKGPIEQFKGWMRSDVTNAPKTIYILGQDNNESQVAACIPRIATAFEETYGVPAFADFDVVSFTQVGPNFLPTDGFSIKSFLDTQAPFTVHMEYDGATLERQFSKQEIQKQIDLFASITSLRSIPRVMRKEDATKPHFNPLRPLTNATPLTKNPSDLRLINPEDRFDPSPTGSMVLRPK